MNESAKVRAPAVSGFFYSGERSELLNEISRCFSDKRIGPGVSFPLDKELTPLSEEQENRIGCFVVPHAGYAYSGPVAAHSFFAAHQFLISQKGKLTVIIFGPNHYGIGSGVALSPSDQWMTPLGSVRINHDISKEILGASEVIDVDSTAHSREHSIEVQIPFLQAVTREEEFSIVPICLMLQDKDTAQEIGQAVAEIIQSKRHEKDTFLVIGSSDLTHYEPQERANSQDLKVLDKVQKLDIGAFYTTLERNDVTACGYGAIAATMEISKRLGRRVGKLLKYATSGDVTGDKSSVVGYSAVNFV